MNRTIKPERYIWNEKDFDDLGWHDNRIRAMYFEHKDFMFCLSIDYIYQWEENFKGYWITPAMLCFQNISHLDIRISCNDSFDVIIEDVFKSKERSTPNGLLTESEYLVKTNVGAITFFSTGFELVLKEDPKFSESQDFEM